MNHRLLQLAEALKLIYMFSDFDPQHDKANKGNICNIDTNAGIGIGLILAW